MTAKTKANPDDDQTGLNVAGSRKLDPRETVFVEEYLIDLNPKRAAKVAGYSATMAASKAYQWVCNGKAKPHVFAAIQARMGDRSKRTGITQEYVLETIQTTIERCLQAEPVRDKEGNPTGEYKFDASAVLKGTELLGRHLGTWNDKITVKGDPENPLAVLIRDIQGSAIKPKKKPQEDE